MLKRLYALSASLLILHEIDSAYWREWEVLGLPGGVGLFLALHLPLLLLLLWGYEQVATGERAAARAATVLALAGIAAPAIHGVLLWRGEAAFRTPVSLAVLGATLLTSLALALAASTHRASRTLLYTRL